MASSCSSWTWCWWPWASSVPSASRWTACSSWWKRGCCAGAAAHSEAIMQTSLSTPPWRYRRQLRGAAFPLTLLLLWWAAYATGWTESPLLVPPQKVVETFWRLAAGGELWHALGASLLRDLAGLAIGSMAGV